MSALTAVFVIAVAICFGLCVYGISTAVALRRSRARPGEVHGY
jgi:hypothetical protein